MNQHLTIQMIKTQIHGLRKHLDEMSVILYNLSSQ